MQFFLTSTLLLLLPPLAKAQAVDTCNLPIADFAQCAGKNVCGNCDIVYVNVIVGSNCDEFNTWYNGNLGCCGDATCDDELNVMNECMECSGSAPTDPAPAPTDPAPAPTDPAPAPTDPAPAPAPAPDSGSSDAACFQCLETSGADPGDCTTQCGARTTDVVSTTSSQDAECFECWDGTATDPGDCDDACEESDRSDASSLSAFGFVSFAAVAGVMFCN